MIGTLFGLLAAAPTAEAATRAALARVRRVDARVHAVLALDPTALAQARTIDRRHGLHGPLYGQILLVKDNIETAGPLPTTAGSLALLANVSGHDAPLVARLRAADAVILGKANLSEWANARSSHAMSGWSAVGGQTRNPHALDRSPCGSSSGSAAAVAAGYVPAAIGTETDGSITCPAAMVGVVGLKPTVGLVSRSRIVPISHVQDTPGPIARDVSTVARVLAVIAGSDPADPATRDADAHRTDYAAALRRDALRGARIGVLRFATGWSPAVDAVFAHALTVLRAQGATLIDIPALPGRERIGMLESAALDIEFKADLEAYLATTPPGVRTRTLADLVAFNRRHAARELGLFGQDRLERRITLAGLNDPTYRETRAAATRLAGVEGIDAMLAAARLDALVAPTAAPAWIIDAVNGDQPAGGGAGSLAAVAGYPHLTVPMGAVRGLPLGLSMIGPAWSEARLLGFGFAFEQAARAAVRPRFRASIEAAPPVATLLVPQGR